MSQAINSINQENNILKIKNTKKLKYIYKLQQNNNNLNKIIYPENGKLNTKILNMARTHNKKQTTHQNISKQISDCVLDPYFLNGEYRKEIMFQTEIIHKLNNPFQDPKLIQKIIDLSGGKINNKTIIEFKKIERKKK